MTVLTDAGVERQPREEERRPREEDREGAAAPLDPTAGVEGRLSEEEEDDRAGSPLDGGVTPAGDSTSSGEDATEELVTTSISLKTTYFDIITLLLGERSL